MKTDKWIKWQHRGIGLVLTKRCKSLENSENFADRRAIGQSSGGPFLDDSIAETVTTLSIKAEIDGGINQEGTV